MIKTILFAGVGGDGIVTVSDVLSVACMESGYDVKKSEIHGMSQRGGSVSAVVRFGHRVYSPTAKSGDIDFLFATEKIEALRANHMLKPETIAIIDDRIVPIMGHEIDETQIDHLFSLLKYRAYVRKFHKDAEYLGNPRVKNTVMLGMLSKLLNIGESSFEDALAKVLPQKLIEINVRAFKLGISIHESPLKEETSEK